MSSHLRVFHERIKHARRVGAAADAGDDFVGEPAELVEALLPGFAADDRLKIADHHGKRMRADDRTDDVVRVLDRSHPVAHGFVDGVAQRPRAAGDRANLGPHRPHDEDVQPLPADVFFAHVDDARQPEMGAGGGGGDAMLPGPGLGDDARLSHPLREQRLADGVVDLVRAGVVEVFALEIDSRPAAELGQPLGEIEGAGAADIMPVADPASSC